MGGVSAYLYASNSKKLSETSAEFDKTEKQKEENEAFDPIRHAPPHLAAMSDAERAELIAKNPDYGIIICRCEEVSRGEILDALNSPICVPTVDGIKKRVAAKAASARRW